MNNNERLLYQISIFNMDQAQILRNIKYTSNAIINHEYLIAKFKGILFPNQL